MTEGGGVTKSQVERRLSDLSDGERSSDGNESDGDWSDNIKGGRDAMETLVELKGKDNSGEKKICNEDK